MKRFSLFLFALAVTAAPLLAQTAAPAKETWGLDKAHSNVTFKVRHMMSKVTGQFRDFDITLDIDRANPAASSVEFTIQTASIDTGNTNRDDHLRTPDFFDAAKFPTITFKSTSVREKSKNEYEVTGDFTMRGVTKRITLPVTFLGFLKDPRGNEKGGFEIETTVNRKDYDIVWNRNLDEGGVVLGDEVKISINLQVARKKG